MCVTLAVVWRGEGCFVGRQWRFFLTTLREPFFMAKMVTTVRGEENVAKQLCLR